MNTSRHRKLVSLCLLLAAGCAPLLPPRGNPGMRDVSFPLRSMRLPSGLRIVIEEDKRSPVVGVITVVGVGSSGDPVGKEGMAHLVEHLTFRAKPNTRTSLRNKLAQAGVGMFNAETSLDTTIYYEMAQKDALPELLKLEGDRILSPLNSIDAATFNVEREVVRNELRERNEMGYQGQVFSWMQEAVFPPGHAYARPLAGTHESLSAITLADAQAFTRQHYRPENMTMVIIGDVDLKTVDAIIDRAFPPGLLSGTKGGPQPPRLSEVPPEPPAPPKVGDLARHEAPVPTPQVWIAWSLPRSFDADHYLQQFAYQSAVRQIGRAYREDNDISNLSVSVVPGKESSMLLCSVWLREGTDPKKSAEHVLDQLYRMWVPETTSEGQTLEDIDFARRRIAAVTGMTLDAESLIERGKLRAEFTHFGGDPTVYSRGLKAISQLDSTRVATFAQKYLSRDRARIVYLSPLPGTATPPALANAAVAAAGDDTTAPAPDTAAMKDKAVVPGVSAYRRFVLRNGLEVIIGRRAGLPVVTVGAALFGGTGMAQPFGAAELADIVAYRGSSFNGQPSEYGAHAFSNNGWDAVTYGFSGGARNVAALIAMLAEQLQSMKAQEGFIVYMSEFYPVLKKVEQRPEERANRSFWAALLDGHPYGRVATAADMEKLGIAEVNGWIAQTHVPRNGVVAIVGEIEPEEVEPIARHWLETWTAAGDAVVMPGPMEGRSGSPKILLTHRPGATQGEIRLGCVLPAADETSALRGELMAELATERLTRSVRQDIGASYGFHARSAVLRGGTSYLVLSGNADNGNLPKALSAVKEALVSFGKDGVTPTELDRARWALLNRYSVSHGSSYSLVNDILDTRNMGWSLESIDRYPERLLGVTAAELQRSFASCAASRQVLSVVGDEPTVNAAVTGVW